VDMLNIKVQKMLTKYLWIYIKLTQRY